MLIQVSSKTEIAKCQSIMKKALINSLPDKGLYTIGYHSGSIDSQIYSDSEIWFSPNITHTDEKKYWNGFGLSKNLSKTKSNSITVEINILHGEANNRIAGAFVKDDKTGDIYLTHSGKVGGGRKGIGKNSFIKWYKAPTKTITTEGNKTKQVIVITNINSTNFVKDLATFIKNVDTFKIIAAAGEINEATILSDKELKEKALSNNSKKRPKKSKTTSTVYDRNKFISEYAKRRAKGKCQLCIKKAPFKNKSGQPYLESHHIIWLSKGGKDTIENTVALCPNCHKKMHIINSKSDIKKLINAAKSPNE